MTPDDPAYGPDGLAPAVVQDAATGQVLMLAWVNREALAATIDTGHVHFWSRSRNELWRKGATSGNTLELVDLRLDCDSDALLITARPAGPACHTGARSCFGDEHPQGFASLEALWATIAQRAAARPAGSYTAELLAGGLEAVGAKVLEEAAEVVEAARREGPRRTAEEAADLLYHLLVLLAERDVEPRQVLGVLTERAQ